MFISKRTEILNLLIYPHLYKIYIKSQNYSLKMETFTHPFFFLSYSVSHYAIIFKMNELKKLQCIRDKKESSKIFIFHIYSYTLYGQ